MTLNTGPTSADPAEQLLAVLAEAVPLLRQVLAALQGERTPAPAERLPLLLTIPETARELRVTPTTVYHMIRDGQLGVTKVRGATRIRREVLERYIVRRTRRSLPERGNGPSARSRPPAGATPSEAPQSVSTEPAAPGPIPSPGPLTPAMEAVLDVLADAGGTLPWEELAPQLEKKLGRSFRAGTIGTILSALERRGLIVLDRGLCYRLASQGSQPGRDGCDGL
jgi:excisionase family DNA binding protein